MKHLYNLIAEHEDWLIQQILNYAKKYGYVKYTSTLHEAWRISISGISKSLMNALLYSDKVRELGPDDDYTRDPIAAFGIREAELHRARGINFSMFMGLMKYYRQSYQDLVRQADFDHDYAVYSRLFIDRFFDRIEIGFSVKWLESTENELSKELQVANRNLTNEKNKYLTIFESSPNAVILFNDDSTIEHLNFAAIKLLEGTHAPGASYYSHVDYEKQLSWLKEELATFLAINEPEVILEKEISTSQGIRYFHVKMARMLDISDKFINTMVIFVDITKGKMAEQLMEKKTLELERSNAELQQFAYVASHDLQEPLRMVASYVQLLARRYKGKLDQDADEFIEFAVDGSKRMQQLINDLLTYARLDKNSNPSKVISSDDVIQRVMDNLKMNIEESGAIITADPLPYIMADPMQIEQLFLNLIGNAIKFRGDNTPRIHISVSNTNDEYVFSVSDNGIGIAPEFFERIFIIFQRLHIKSEYPGTGIGLAICKKIVERNGGHIWIESEPGSGTTFFFTIPKTGGN